MLSEISVYLRGSCEFEAIGDFPERFLNLCARADLGLWHIERCENGIRARVIARYYRHLLPYARRCGIRLKSLRRFGLPFILTPYRRRPGMPLGFMLFCGMLWFLSLFIWSVELPELSPEATESLQCALEDMDISVGTLRSHIEAERMSVELQMRVPQLTWAGISTFGSYLSVDAKEYEPVSASPAEGQPCNLVACCEGVILNVEPLRGSVEVQPGQAVVKGDLLVSGVVEHLDGSVQITDASAVVWAATTRELSCTMPFRQLVWNRTGRIVTRHRVKLFGLELPLLLSMDDDGRYEREVSDWQLSAGSMKLPLEVHTEKCYELEELSVVYTPEEAEALAVTELEKRLSAIEGVEILEKQFSVARTDSGVTVTLLVTLKENIASPSAIGIQ